MLHASATSERILVHYRPGEGARALAALQDLAGLRPSEVPRARDFDAAPARATRQPALRLEGIGVMALDPELVDPARLRGELPEPLLSARREGVFRRPRTVREPRGPAVVPYALPKAAPGAVGLSRALELVGVTADEAEGEGVVVAVLDSGVQADHPDLKHALTRFEPYSFVPGKPANVDPAGHGTHCAGLIAGSEAPVGGLRYGVAPKAQLMVLRIFDELDERAEADVLLAVRWAATHGARILSLSAGRVAGAGTLGEDDALGMDLRAHGALLVAAAGNESNRAAYDVRPCLSPASARGVLAVGAVDRQRKLWNDSNGRVGAAYTMVDVVAPGVGVESADPDGTLTAQTGTSVATPIVSGVLAVLLSREPALGPDALVSRLEGLALSLPNAPSAGVGHGLVRVSEVS